MKVEFELDDAVAKKLQGMLPEGMTLAEFFRVTVNNVMVQMATDPQGIEAIAKATASTEQGRILQKKLERK